MLYVCNVEEGSADRGNAFSKTVEDQAAEEGAAAVIVSAKIESEIAVLAEDEQRGLSRGGGSRGAGAQPRHPRGL